MQANQIQNLLFCLNLSVVVSVSTDMVPPWFPRGFHANQIQNLLFCLNSSVAVSVSTDMVPPCSGGKSIAHVKRPKSPTNQPTNPKPGSGRKVLPLASNCAQFQFRLMISGGCAHDRASVGMCPMAQDGGQGLPGVER